MNELSRLRIKYILKNGDSDLRRKLASELRAALSKAKFNMLMGPQKRALIKMAAMLILTTSLMMHTRHHVSMFWAYRVQRQPIVMLYKEGSWRA